MTNPVGAAGRWLHRDPSGPSGERPVNARRPRARTAARRAYDRVSSDTPADLSSESGLSAPSPPPPSRSESAGTATSSTPLTGGSGRDRESQLLETCAGETSTSGSGSGGNDSLLDPSSTSAVEEEEGGEAANATGNGNGTGSAGGSLPASLSLSKPPSRPPIRDPITVVVLDTAHAKFRVPADPSWTVRQFKLAGAVQHRVQAKSQRLIHMGKLLQDEETLRDSGIAESDKIVHLFPKPNVVVQKEEEEASSAAGSGGVDDDGARAADGAHVPRIVLDAAEAERRSQILVLSSAEVFEAQHRVKLLSFLLLVVSSMELLTLFTILLGMPASSSGYDDDSYPPLDPTDTSPRGGGGSGGGGAGQVRPWRTSDYFDLAVSSFGFYVATLGIKAATENTSAAARQYLYCLLVSGAGWCGYYYYLSLRDLRAEAEDEQEAARGGGSSTAPSSDADDAELYSQAFFSILLPIFVWMICFIRAFQFRQLIEEAETEAEERTRSFAAEMMGDDDDEEDEFDDEAGATGGNEERGAELGRDGGGGGRTQRAIPFGTEGAMDDLDSLELQVQVEGRTIT